MSVNAYQPMKTCPACATENPAANQYCSVCGGVLAPILAMTVDHVSQPSNEPPSTPDSNSSFHGSFLPETKIAGRFRIVSLAGRGGMGEVYRADDLKLGHPVAQQLCAGPAAAHEKGVLHRDLKPANVMIDGRGQVRITDFGLARLADSAIGAGEIAGTPAYMAPEQLGHGETTIQSDLYSLGLIRLILYEVYTGHQVYKGKTNQEIRREREELSLTHPSELVPDIDPAVERAILRCLQQEPGQRPKSARAVAAALTELGHLNLQAKPHWQEWFPKELTGFDLSALESIEPTHFHPVFMVSAFLEAPWN